MCQMSFVGNHQLLKDKTALANPVNTIYTRPEQTIPRTYQDFFTALDKAMFLAQNQVN